jgi:hypothetical protein
MASEAQSTVIGEYRVRRSETEHARRPPTLSSMIMDNDYVIRCRITQ